MRRAAAVAVAVAALAVGCTRGGASPEVSIRMTTERLSVQPTSAEAGRVRIFIDNETDEEHDLVFAYARTIEELPRAADGTVKLEGVNLADQLDPVGPGRYKIEPLLRAGQLVVFCNLVSEGPDGAPSSHLERGMWAPLRIVGGEVTTTAPPG